MVVSSPLMVVQVSCSVSCGTEAFQRAQNAAVPVAPIARPSAHVGPDRENQQPARAVMNSTHGSGRGRSSLNAVTQQTNSSSAAENRNLLLVAG